MHSFGQLTSLFTEKFTQRHFPVTPASLYDPAEYFLRIGGKRIRPVACLMGNELFGDIDANTWHVANAIELFHNFTLIHDDIMDHAPLRRGMETVHEKYGESTALLAGDVMMVAAYDYLNKVTAASFHLIMQLFNRTARQVCEGQQLDMDFEKRTQVEMDEYLYMIELKTSVLLASALRMGAILGGAGEGNQQHIYEFGRNLGIAFQVQDDYLDAFGDAQKVGKQTGGDILANKKTFLVIQFLNNSSPAAQQELLGLMHSNPPDKVEKVLALFREQKVDEWALELTRQYMDRAMQRLEDIAVLKARKEPLEHLAEFLMKREY